MNWRRAFFRQAISENEARRKLNTPEIPYSHRLHYLQMVTEKLAKGFQTRPDDAEGPPLSHGGFTRFLQTLKGQPGFRALLRFPDAASLRRYIDSLLVLTREIDQLAPSAAGQGRPNPEYPWRDLQNVIQVPVEYDFRIFNPVDPKMAQLERLLALLMDSAAEE